jgi:hypothetical protein
MTTHKRAQEQLLAAKEEAERSNRFKDQFLSGSDSLGAQSQRSPIGLPRAHRTHRRQRLHGPLNRKCQRRRKQKTPGILAAENSGEARLISTYLYGS